MLRQLIFRTLITNFSISALGLVNSILLSRWLGPDGRGEIAAALLWGTVLPYLSSLGIISSVLYFSALPESETKKIFANSLMMAGLQSLVVVPLALTAIPWLLSSQTPAVISAARLHMLGMPISLVTLYGVSILQGRMHIRAYNWLRMIIPVGYLLGAIFLIAFSGLTLLNIVILHLSLNLITLIGTLFRLLKAGVRFSLRGDISLMKQMLRYGLRIHVGTVSGFANMSLDQVLMAAWLAPVYLGLYTVAVSSASISQVFSQAVQMVLTPGITQKESPSERTAMLKGVFRRYWMLSFLIMLIIGALLPVAIPIVFGDGFRDAIWPAEILLVGTLFIGAKEVLAGGAQALGNPWLGSKSQLWALCVTFSLLYLLLPRLGILGAAVASATAYATQFVIVIYGLRRSHDISPVDLFSFKPKDLGSALNISDLIKGHRARLLSDQG
jgi:O-antigen/teichoic acid export membrane protein